MAGLPDNGSTIRVFTVPGLEILREDQGSDSGHYINVGQAPRTSSPAIFNSRNRDWP